jgi:hypothetical protein
LEVLESSLGEGRDSEGFALSATLPIK